MMKLSEYAAFDGLGLAGLVRSGEISPDELVVLAGEAISKLNPLLNFMASNAQEDARLAPPESGERGAFHGLPFLMKAGVAVKGQPLGIGSRITEGMTSPIDEEFTLRCRRAGLRILGHTTAPEFGNSPTTESVLYGSTLNPWNTQRMTGGSSGGACAAVASGVIPIAMASDGGGSIRTPAHCCGLFGMKPTRGRNPLGPRTQGGIYALAAQHVVTRTVRDSAAMMDVLCGVENGTLYHVAPPARPFLDEVGTAPRPLRIAFSTRNPSGGAVHADCVEGVRQAMRVCADLGHSVEEVCLPYDWEAFSAVFKVLWATNLPFSLRMIESVTGRKPGPDTLEACNLVTLDYGRQLNMEDVGRALFAANELCQAVAAFFSNFDVYVTPTNASPAVALGEIDGNAADLTFDSWYRQSIERFAPFPPVFNVTGQPAMSVPLWQCGDGLPVGVHFAGRHGDERTLFQLAGQLEAAMPWSGRVPGTSVF